MRKRSFVWVSGVLAIALNATACVRYESAYERAVYDDEPVYCYQRLGGVDCYRTPYARDRRVLVNYYGPAPSKYPQPVVEVAEPQPPPPAEKATAEPPPGDSSISGWIQWLPVVTATLGVLQFATGFLF